MAQATVQIGRGGETLVCSLDALEDTSLPSLKVGAWVDEEGFEAPTVRKTETSYALVDYGIDHLDVPHYRLFFQAADNHARERKKGLTGEQLLQKDVDFYSAKPLEQLHIQADLADYLDHNDLHEAVARVLVARGEARPLQLVPIRDPELSAHEVQRYERLLKDLNGVKLFARYDRLRKEKTEMTQTIERLEKHIERLEKQLAGEGSTSASV